MKLLITGGNGYIARNLKPLFEQNGYSVFAPSHKELDLLNYNVVEEYLRYGQFDAVIHAAIKGGNRTKKDTFNDVYIPNIKMFENIAGCLSYKKTPIIIFGSGAEFDRRSRIKEENECAVAWSWPIDPYGLSKNIITKRSLYSFSNIWILRLFGCFNFDEDNTRFIKNSILNLRKGLPIEIHQNKYMDFFYLDDVFTVVDYILKNGGPRDINLVYKEKTDLMGIANLIRKYCGLPELNIKIIDWKNGDDYTGCGNILDKLPISKKILGLEEGIKRTTCKL